MSRVIKFRAWVVNGGAMGSWEDITKECDRFSLLKDDNFIFMQFTGLTDKNGVDIYEGDIVRYWSLFECHSDAVDYFGVEPENNWPVSEVYLEKKDGAIVFGSSQFSVDGKNISTVGKLAIDSIIDCHWRDQLGSSIYDFLYEFHDGKFKSSIKKQVSELEVIGNIHQNSDLLEKG